MRIPKIINSSPIKISKFFKILKLIVKFPAGNEEIYHVLQSSDVVMILVLTKDGKMLLLEQWKAAQNFVSDGMSLELPAGAIEPGENSRDAAIRELREEAGLKVVKKDLELLACMHHNSARDTMRVHLFLLNKPVEIDLRALASRQELDATEFLELKLFSLSQMLKLFKEKGKVEGATVAAISLAAALYPKRFK